MIETRSVLMNVCAVVLMMAARLPAQDAAQRFKLDGVVFEGATVFSHEQLLAAISDVIKREGGRLSLDDLEEARQRITLLYINAGYINSGAVLPEQNIEQSGATVRFTIIEGRLTQINLENKTRLRKEFVEPRIQPVIDAPLNALELRDRLELLRLNPNISSVVAELRPGIRAGEGMLDVTLNPSAGYQLGLQFDNNRSPSVGAERLSVFGTHYNVLGLGDTLGFRWGLNKGDIVDGEFAGVDDVSLSYAIPINRHDTTLQFSFENSDSPVVEEPFADLNIRSKTEGFSIGLRQPLWRTPNSELAVSMVLSRRDNRNYLAGEPFSFSPGSENGRSTVTALRFGQEWMRRTQDDALALRSTFSFGLDALDATINGNGLPDGHFFSWLVQGQYIKRLPADWQLIFRGTVQMTDDALPPLEQFSLGGVDSVRGYRENQLVRDIAAVASVELRVPLVRKNGRSVLELAAFVDGGYARNNSIPGIATADDEFISSAGLGVLWNPSSHFSLAVYWGHPFKTFEQTSDNLQDQGVHFSLIATWP